jgi:maltooligosyltrehalose trehalohydrolase
MIPLLFMGDDDGSREPFLFFTDFHDTLADAVREGRRGEFAHFDAFADPARREQIPDPNAETTFESSGRNQRTCWPAGTASISSCSTCANAMSSRTCPARAGHRGAGRQGAHRTLAPGQRQQLRIDLNLDAQPQAAQLPAQALRLFDSSDTAHPDSTLAAHSCVVSLLPPAPETP